jgi:hypothetical protein
MVYDARTVPTDEEAARLLREHPESVFSRVLLSAAKRELPAEAGPGDGSAIADVTALEYRPKRSVWRVRTDRPGYLFTGDAYYPGWRAELDGKPATLYRANLAFRAVHVPSGEHVVVYRFSPLSVQLGIAISTLSLLLAGWLVVQARIRDRSGAA